MCQVRNIPFEDQTNSFFLSFGPGVYILKRIKNQFKMLLEMCIVLTCSLNSEKCESIGGHLTTPRSIYGCGNCGARLFVHKVLFTLQEHVKTTKTDKTRFFFTKKHINLVPDKQFLPYVPIQSTKYR